MVLLSSRIATACLEHCRSAVFILKPILTVLLMGFLGFGINAVFIPGSARSLLSQAFRVERLLSECSLRFQLALLVGSLHGSVPPNSAIRFGETRHLNSAAAVTIGNVQNKWEFFNFADNSQLDKVDDRLNQNYLLGAAVRAEAGHVKMLREKRWRT